MIVLYNQTPRDSAAVAAFLAVLEQQPGLCQRFDLLLYDNSPATQLAAIPSALACHYHHDPANRGLASAYNYALERARLAGSAWLLLLDQDTGVTPAYLQEALTLADALADDRRIAVIVPKLASAKGIKSPTLGFLEWLRRQVQFPRQRALFATGDLYGPQSLEWTAFNSASVLRVAALDEIGGFPAEFWLDFLDTAVFHDLHAAGRRIFVMHSTLQHELSMDTQSFYEKQTGLERHKNLLAAMVRFVRRSGTARDLWLTRIWLLRNAMHLYISAKDKRFSMASLVRALRPGQAH